MPWESAAPFVLITGAIIAMGQILDASERLAYGRPKTTGLDQWDRGLAERDLRFAKSWDKWLQDHAVGTFNRLRVTHHDVDEVPRLARSSLRISLVSHTIMLPTLRNFTLVNPCLTL